MKITKKKKTIVFDFDGVIHSYTSGWHGNDVVADPPVEGIKEAIDDLKDDYEIVIVSTRCSTTEGTLAIIDFMHENNIHYDRILKEKPPAVCYIDDRAICFDGQTDTLADKVRNFKSWTEV